MHQEVDHLLDLVGRPLHCEMSKRFSPISFSGPPCTLPLEVIVEVDGGIGVGGVPVHLFVVVWIHDWFIVLFIVLSLLLFFSSFHCLSLLLMS